MSIDDFMQRISPQYSREDFIAFELWYSSQGGYGMNFTTPYDYLALYSSIFPIDAKQSQQINFFLDFSITLSELMLYTAE
jgi:hypothetical protein